MMEDVKRFLIFIRFLDYLNYMVKMLLKDYQKDLNVRNVKKKLAKDVQDVNLFGIVQKNVKYNF